MQNQPVRAFRQLFDYVKSDMFDYFPFISFFFNSKKRFVVNVVRMFAQCKKTKTITCAVHSTAIEPWVASAVVSSHGIGADGIHLTLMIVIEAFVNVWKINLFVFLR